MFFALYLRTTIRQYFGNITQIGHNISILHNDASISRRNLHITDGTNNALKREASALDYVLNRSHSALTNDTVGAFNPKGELCLEMDIS